MEAKDQEAIKTLRNEQFRLENIVEQNESEGRDTKFASVRVELVKQKLSLLLPH